MSRQIKEKAKGIDQEAQSAETFQQNTCQKDGKVRLEQKIVLRASKRGICGHDRECDYGHPPYCKYFKKKHMSNGKGVLFHTLTKEESIYQSKRKRQRKDAEQEKVTVAIVSIAHQYFREAFAIRNFQEHPFQSRGEPRASGTIQNAHERHSCAQKKTSVREEKHQILILEFGESRIQRQISILERDLDQQ